MAIKHCAKVSSVCVCKAYGSVNKFCSRQMDRVIDVQTKQDVSSWRQGNII
jgi:hypothetical protein